MTANANVVRAIARSRDQAHKQEVADNSRKFQAEAAAHARAAAEREDLFRKSKNLLAMIKKATATSEANYEELKRKQATSDANYEGLKRKHEGLEAKYGELKANYEELSGARGSSQGDVKDLQLSRKEVARLRKSVRRAGERCEVAWIHAAAITAVYAHTFHIDGALQAGIDQAVKEAEKNIAEQGLGREPEPEEEDSSDEDWEANAGSAAAATH
jgi:chromosome segregation ATPase